MNIFWFCCFFRQLRRSGKEKHEIDTEPPIEYPWNAKETLDPKDFILEDKLSGVFGRQPGEINGQQFVVRNCKNVFVYLLDHINTMMIDDCENCVIVTGPVKASVFIRDCKNCRLLTACQQFRTRDCQSITTFLACVTEPIIESSFDMYFGPYQCFYPELEKQFAAAGLSIFNCNWSDIYDFTPDQDGHQQNAKFFGLDDPAAKYIPTPQEALARESKAMDATTESNECSVTLIQPFSMVPISFDRSDSLVPLTLGRRAIPSDGGDQQVYKLQLDRSVLIVLFNHPEVNTWAKDILTQLRKHDSCHLVRTRCSKFSEYEMERIFGVPAKSKLAKVGSVITLEVAGPANLVGPICEEAVDTMNRTHSNSESKTFVRCTVEPVKAKQQIEQLNGLYRIHMNAN